MGHTRGRLFLVVMMALAALATFGPSPASAAPAAAVEDRTTTLVAGHPNALGVHVNLLPRAKLTDTATGAPLAGQVVAFVVGRPYAGSYAVCWGTTDAAGVAKCGGPRVFQDILQIGWMTPASYQAVYSGATVGDVRYARSTDIVKLLARQ
ncbi:MAG TPA: hypothetical protein VFO49_16995 [Nocardioides sp.]|nr:hypothetical protein [Nocardioides sp.]